MTGNTLPSSMGVATAFVTKFKEMREAVVLAMKSQKEYDFPLDDRWAFYLEVESLLPISRYIPKSIRVMSDRIYDDYFPDGRGMTLNSTIDETMMENKEYLESEDTVDDEWTANARIASAKEIAKRDEWREAVMAEGYGGFIFDW